MSEISNSEELQNPGQIASQIAPNIPPEQADSIRKAIWHQFKKDNGQGWRIRWNKTTGLPASIFSGLTQKAYPGNAEQAARTFLKEHRTLFGVADLTDLDYIKTQTHKGIRHVTFNQAVNGVPVYEAEYKVHLRTSGKVDMANGTYYPDIDITTTPSISGENAIGNALSDLGGSENRDFQTDASLVVYPYKDEFRLTWKVLLFSEDPISDWFYMIDAVSGETLYKLNRLTDVIGDGDVYPTHPGLSSVTNTPLYRLNGNGKLQGTYAYIVNDESSEAYSSSNSFQYSTSSTHFDEANLYYHIDNFRHNFVEGLISGSFGFQQIKAHAHATHSVYGDLNAWFSPSSKEIYFGDASSSSSYNNFAWEDKVIHHEYGHAVIYEIQSGIQSSNNEEGAISEGTPDYFSGSFTVRSMIGEYIGSTRDMANPYYTNYSQLPRDQYGNVNVSAHTGGEFFSSILWDLQGIISSTDVDFLVYDALYRITNGPDFLEFRDAMMAADAAAYSGSNSDDIQNTFADRGVGTHVPPDVTISGPDNMFQGSSDTFTANVSGGHPPYQYQWYYKNYSDSFYVKASGETSSTYTHTAGPPPSGKVKVMVIDNVDASQIAIHNFSIIGFN